MVIRCVTLAAPCLLAICGCSTPPEHTHPRDIAEQDPMNYNPVGDQKKYDISGGGILQFDRGAFKKDMDNALSP